jgi:hypothetical protein
MDLFQERHDTTEDQQNLHEVNFLIWVPSDVGSAIASRLLINKSLKNSRSLALLVFSLLNQSPMSRWKTCISAIVAPEVSKLYQPGAPYLKCKI